MSTEQNTANNNANNQTQNKETSQKQPNKKKRKPNKEEGFQFNFFWIYAILGVILLLGTFSNFSEKTAPVSMPELRQMITDNEVLAVKIVGHKKGLVYLKDSVLNDPKHNEVAKEKFGT